MADALTFKELLGQDANDEDRSSYMDYAEALLRSYAPEDDFYEHVMQNCYSGWDEHKRREFDAAFAQTFAPKTFVPSDPDINEEAYRIVKAINDVEKKAARYENRKSKLLRYDEEFMRKLARLQEESRFIRERNRGALKALEAVLEDATKAEAQAIRKDSYVLLEQAKIDEAQSQMAAGGRACLVRGAILRCTCGTHMRRLNLPRDHGVRIGANPQIHEKDAVPSVFDGEGGNIEWFGHCLSQTDPPEETVDLEDFTPVDDEGNPLREQPRRTTNAPRCQPRFHEDVWRNCDPRIAISEDFAASAWNAAIPFYYAATTQSYIMCVHGGMVYPYFSGQIAFFVYSPPFAACPFKMDTTPESNFIKWCDEKGVCPYLPGTAEYHNWYQKAIRKCQVDGELARRRAYVKVHGGNYSFYELYESSYIPLGVMERAEMEIGAATKLYDQWLTGLIQSGTLENKEERQAIESGNPVRDAYYAGCDSLPPLEDEIKGIQSEFTEPWKKKNR